MADMRQQFQQEDLATGLSLAKAGPWEMNLAQGYAAGAGAGRELAGLFGAEDPRIQEQRAVARAIDEMEKDGGFRNPANLYKIGQYLIQQGDYDRGAKLIELGQKIESAQARGTSAKTYDIPKLDDSSKKTIRGMLDDAGFNVSGWDFSGKDFPQGMSEDRVINAIWALHQKFNLDLGSATDQVIADIENRVGSSVTKSTGKAPTYTRPE